MEAELRVPAEHLLRPPDFLLAERRAMRLRGVLSMGSRVGDMTSDRDERRALALVTCRLDRELERRDVVDVVDALHMPAVRPEALLLILRVETDGGRPVDRDVVVVVADDQLAEAELARDRGRLVTNPLHQIAVRRDDVDAVIDERVARPVVALGQKALGDRHADRVAEPLAERPGRRLHTRRVTDLRMSRRPRAPLTKGLEVVE